MQDVLQALRGLQEIDRHIFRVNAELKRLPAELSARQQQLSAIEHEIEVRNGELAELRANVKEIDDTTTGLRQRLRKLDVESTSGKIDAAMLASYQHEMRQVKRTIGQAEDDGLEMVGQAEELEARVKELEERLAGERTVFAEFEQNVANETAAAEARLAELQGQRGDTSSSAIDAATLDTYGRILTLRGGEALAPLDGQICQGCFVEIPRNLSVRLARGVELVQCPSCNRILYQA